VKNNVDVQSQRKKSKWACWNQFIVGRREAVKSS